LSMVDKSSINIRCDISNSMSDSLTPRSKKQQSLIEHLDSKIVRPVPKRVKDASTESTLSDFREFLALLDEEYARTTNNDKNFSGWEVSSEPGRLRNRRRKLYIESPPTGEDPHLKKQDIVREKVNIDVEIKGLKDLLKLIEDYPLADNIEYKINM
jgi:hypothetical protein